MPAKNGSNGGTKLITLALTACVSVGGIVWGLSSMLAEKADRERVLELERDLSKLREEFAGFRARYYKRLHHGGD